MPRDLLAGLDQAPRPPRDLLAAASSAPVPRPERPPAGAIEFLAKNDHVRSQLSPNVLADIDAGRITPEIEQQLFAARNAADASFQTGIENWNAEADLQTGRTKSLGRRAAGLSGFANASTFGLRDRVQSLLPGQTLKGARSQNAEIAAAHPIAYAAGTVSGFLAPGAGVFKAADKGLKALGSATGASRLIPGGASRAARGARYGARLGGLAAVGAADGAVFGATVASSDKEAQLGRNLTGAERGHETSLNARTGAVAGPLLSLGYRGGRKIFTGTATPTNVSAQVGTAGGSAVAGAFGSDTLSGADVQSLELVQRLLRNAGVSEQRIRQGLENIAPDGSGRADLGTLIEREFADDAPGIAEGLRSVVLRSGVRGSDATRETLRGRIDDLRGSQADDFRQQAANELGDQSRFQAGQEIQGQLDEIGEAYNTALAAAPRQGQQAEEAVQVAAQSIADIPGANATIATQALRQNITPEEYIARNPYQALHDIQSSIQSVDLVPVRKRLQALIERDVPEYAAARQEYARVAGARDALGSFRRGSTLGAAEKQQAGFGDRLVSANGNQGGATRTQLGEEQLADQYARIAAGDDQTLAAANLSIRDALTDPLRGSKASSVEGGTDGALARLGQLQSEGVVDALPKILGARGERLSDGLRKLVGERQRLADIDARVGSNTVNKAEAVANGDRQISRGIGRISEDGFDLSRLSRAPAVLRRLSRPRQSQQDRLAELLTRRANGTPSSTPTPPSSRRGLFGGRPAAAADEAVPHDAPVEAGLIGQGATPLVGAGVGAVAAPDLDGDGTVSAHERAGGALGGALTASGVRAGARGLFGRGRPTQQPTLNRGEDDAPMILSRQVDQPATPPAQSESRALATIEHAPRRTDNATSRQVGSRAQAVSDALERLKVDKTTSEGGGSTTYARDLGPGNDHWITIQKDGAGARIYVPHVRGELDNEGTTELFNTITKLGLADHLASQSTRPRFIQLSQVPDETYRAGLDSALQTLGYAASRKNGRYVDIGNMPTRLQEFDFDHGAKLRNAALLGAGALGVRKLFEAGERVREENVREHQERERSYNQSDENVQALRQSALTLFGGNSLQKSGLTQFAGTEYKDAVGQSPDKVLEEIYSNDITKIPAQETNRWAHRITGISEGYLDNLIDQEAAGDWDAANPNSTARGGAQFIESTWRKWLDKYGSKYGDHPDPYSRDLSERQAALDLRNDPRWGTMIAAEFTRENVLFLQNKLNRPVSGKEAYLAHFLGQDAALRALQADPDANASDLFPREAAANRNVFFKGGDSNRPRTVAEMIERQGHKFGSEPIFPQEGVSREELEWQPNRNVA